MLKLIVNLSENPAMTEGLLGAQVNTPHAFVQDVSVVVLKIFFFLLSYRGRAGGRDRLNEVFHPLAHARNSRDWDLAWE